MVWAAGPGLQPTRGMKTASVQQPLLTETSPFPLHSLAGGENSRSLHFGRDDNSYFSRVRVPKKNWHPDKKDVNAQLLPAALKRSSPHEWGHPPKNCSSCLGFSRMLDYLRVPPAACSAVIAKIAKAGCWPFNLQRRFKSLWGSTGTDHNSSW
jgi:hypothetical protein